MPQPQMKRHLGGREVVAQSTICFEQDILHNVARIDTPRELPVETQLNDLPERESVPLEQPIDGIVFAAFDIGEQFLGFTIF
jgi:hypothetical protein